MRLLRLFFIQLLISIANSLPYLVSLGYLKASLYRLAGMNIGARTTITGPLTFRTDAVSNISIGKNCFFNSETRFGCKDSKIQIGDNVFVGPRVLFETATHELMFDDNRGRGGHTCPITIGDKVWIGAGVIILPGVVIGEGSVVCAGGVVNKNVEPYSMVGGVPAKFIKTIS